MLRSCCLLDKAAVQETARSRVELTFLLLPHPPSLFPVRATSGVHVETRGGQSRMLPDEKMSRHLKASGASILESLYHLPRVSTETVIWFVSEEQEDKRGGCRGDQDCVEALRDGWMDTEGLFRIAGSATKSNSSSEPLKSLFVSVIHARLCL